MAGAKGEVCQRCGGSGWLFTPGGGTIGRARKCECRLSAAEVEAREVTADLEALAAELEGGSTP